jgi:hypothetical protein
MLTIITCEAAVGFASSANTIGDPINSTITANQNFIEYSSAPFLAGHQSSGKQTLFGSS